MYMSLYFHANKEYIFDISIMLLRKTTLKVNFSRNLYHVFYECILNAFPCFLELYSYLLLRPYRQAFGFKLKEN